MYHIRDPAARYYKYVKSSTLCHSLGTSDIIGQQRFDRQNKFKVYFTTTKSYDYEFLRNV